MNNWESLAVLLFIIAVVWIFDRKNFKKEGIMYLRRTERGLEVIDSFAKKHTTWLRKLSDFAVVFSFGYLGLKYIYNERKAAKEKKSIWPLFLSYTLIMGIMSVYLDVFFSAILTIFDAPAHMIAFIVPVLKILTFAFGISGYAFFSILLGVVAIISNAVTGGAVQSPISLVLPIDVPASYGLPVYSVPIMPWIISILVILIVHEFSHAIISRVEGIRVKAMGYGFMFIMPLGFAEPDEKQIAKSTSIKKTRIYAAGSFANFLTACFFVLLFFGVSFASMPLVNETHALAGMGYTDTQEEFPAGTYLPDDGVITVINAVPVNNLTGFLAVMDSVSPGENITLVVDNETYEIPTVKDSRNESRAYIGITGIYHFKEIKEDVKDTPKGYLVNAIFYLQELFGWIILLNIGIGIANLMPLKPFDGGLIAEEVIKGARIPQPKKIAGFLGKAMLFILLFALFGPLFLKGFFAFLGIF